MASQEIDVAEPAVEPAVELEAGDGVGQEAEEEAAELADPAAPPRRTATEIANASDNIVRLVGPETPHIEVLLIGTAHISYASVEQVQQLVREVKPKSVFVELCRSRYQILRLPVQRSNPNLQPPEITVEMVLRELRPGGSGFPGLLQLAIASMSSNLAAEMGIEMSPGTEFAAAAQEAFQYGGQIILGDRNVMVTLKRAWRALSLWDKLRLFYSLLFESPAGLTVEDLERMKNTDIISEMIADMTEELPTLVEPLIYERDRYLSYQLRDTCRRLQKSYTQSIMDSTNDDEGTGEEECSKTTVIAVVGMGHVQGIVENFARPFNRLEWEADLKEISSIPPGPSWGSVIATYVILPAVVVTAGVIAVRRIRD